MVDGIGHFVVSLHGGEFEALGWHELVNFLSKKKASKHLQIDITSPSRDSFLHRVHLGLHVFPLLVYLYEFPLIA